MSAEFRSKLKRQLEILGLCLSQNYHRYMQMEDLAELFGVELLTIKRDLNDLRSEGIDIHSVHHKGIIVSRPLSDAKLRTLIQQYAAVSFYETFIEKSTNLMVKHLREKALSNMVALQVCIEKHKGAVIDYEKEKTGTEKHGAEFGREIFPLRIFRTDNYWRVLAMNEGKLKQFHLNKIIEVRESPRKFNPPSENEIDEIFKYSWRSWMAKDRFPVKLEMDGVWAERIKTNMLMEEEKITEVKKSGGKIIYETVVNSLDEVAGWIVSRGKGVKVLEPEELKKKVIKLAKETLKNYKNK